jgi:hypothetical protein
MNQFANLFHQNGFSVVPMEFRSKQPLVKWTEFQKRQPDTELVQRWFSHQVNLGIVTGFNNLTVIDFDDFTEYTKWLIWIANLPTYTLIQRAFTVRSRRGVHVYFRTLQPERNRHIDRIDIKGRYGLVTGPGSTHETGVIYEPLNLFFIPTIEALSDALPPNLLLSVQDINPVVNLPKPVIQPDHDPWETAERGWNTTVGEDLIEKARNVFKIEMFFSTPLRKSGDHFYITRCPFHDDQTPSFWIDAEHQVCGCFVCNFAKPLDVINFYGMLYGLSNREAIFALARMV